MKYIICLLLLSIALPSSAQPTQPAVYQVTFEATWTQDTHPDMFPPNPHFSWLIGGTHNDQVDFWAEGEVASLGIRRMAEWGSTTPLDTEVNAAITAGNAGEIIISDNYPMSPGSVSTTFTVTPAAPLATIVTMIAPSPDWFTGVNSLDLRDGNNWVEELVVDLFPFDAGTDSGATYTSSDQPTTPQVPIAAITGSPFTTGIPVGTLTFALVPVSTGIPAAEILELSSFPNPFNPFTTMSFTTTVSGPVRIAVYDTRGHLVEVLVNEILDKGHHMISWNGKDDRGRQMASGVYFVQAAIGEQKAGQKVMLVR